MEPFDLNIRHLKAVVAIVELGTINAATRAINLTQPAITQGIAKLEAQLDLTLFERRPKGMVPTPAARSFAARIDAALRLMDCGHATGAQARAFVAVARAGSYAGAAAQTGLAEPSLHRAVADLSVSLGHALVERRGKGVSLTPRGTALAKRLSLGEAELRAGLSELELLKGREVGRIVVGAMPLSRARVLPEAVARFHAAHPKMGIRIVEGSHAELVGPLKVGEIDFMVGALRLGLEDNDLTQRQLFIDTPVIFGRAGHPLVGKGVITADDLVTYPWVIAAQGTPLYDQWLALFASLGATPPPIQVECGSVMMVRQILKDSDFLTLLSPDQLAVELEAGWVEIVSSAPGDVSRTIGLTTRADWRPTPLQKGFLDILDTAASDMGG